MRISAKADYAIRAAVMLAGTDGTPTKGRQIAQAEAIPVKFLENILAEMRTAGIVASQRGTDGGYWLARPAKRITLADVIRAVEGPLAAVQGARPETLPKGPLRDVWIALRANLRGVLEKVTLADVAAAKLPRSVARLASDPESWVAH